MKTLNSDRSKDLFYKINETSFHIENLKRFIQNPDIINEENAQANYTRFNNYYNECIKKLQDIRQEAFELHNEIAEIN